MITSPLSSSWWARYMRTSLVCPKQSVLCISTRSTSPAVLTSTKQECTVWQSAKRLLWDQLLWDMMRRKIYKRRLYKLLLRIVHICHAIYVFIHIYKCYTQQAYMQYCLAISEHESHFSYALNSWSTLASKSFNTQIWRVYIWCSRTIHTYEHLMYDSILSVFTVCWLASHEPDACWLCTRFNYYCYCYYYY